MCTGIKNLHLKLKWWYKFALLLNYFDEKRGLQLIKQAIELQEKWRK